MNRVELISTKVKALWMIKDRKAWPKDSDVAGELIRQYTNALEKVPETELGPLLDYFFSADQTKMPQPGEIRAKWYGVEYAEKLREAQDALNKKREDSESVMRDTLNMGASTQYQRDVVKLIERKLRPTPHCEALKQLSDEHRIPCPSVEIMLRGYPKWKLEKESAGIQ